MTSAKNFMLVDDFDDSKVYLLFGKETEDTYNMDVHFPFSIF